MPKQVYIYGDSLLKATMPDEGYIPSSDDVPSPKKGSDTTPSQPSHEVLPEQNNSQTKLHPQENSSCK